MRAVALFVDPAVFFVLDVLEDDVVAEPLLLVVELALRFFAAPDAEALFSAAVSSLAGAAWILAQEAAFFAYAS